jgi:hypothetical protein
MNGPNRPGSAEPGERYWRFVVAIDVEAPTAVEAYGKVAAPLMAAKMKWETTDEAYDDDGEPIDVDKTVESFYAIETKE